jgi:hypothetical protein
MSTPAADNMRRPLLALVILALAACSSSRPPRDSVATGQPLVVSATDTATVRRLCASPDSVLANRAPCVLRADFKGVRRF